MSDTAFPPTSRYYNLPTAVRTDAEGRAQIYLQRRFVPASDRFTLIQEHAVAEGERLDNLTALYLADPEQFWRLCDANDALLPDELTARVGRRLRITLPEGIPGPRNG